MDASGRNDVSGAVHGATVQAHMISGDVHIHSPGDQERLIGLHEELGQVRRQLADSLAAERDLTREVGELRGAVVRLTWERDHLVNEAERRNAELERARTDRLAALHEAQVAQARVRALETGLRNNADAATPPAVVGMTWWVNAGSGATLIGILAQVAFLATRIAASWPSFRLVISSTRGDGRGGPV
ncbi:hypothetical protein ACFV4N_28955, partial [Actinosynnema sp. NPDC059797]